MNDRVTVFCDIFITILNDYVSISIISKSIKNAS